jgi:starch phosphorylase
VAAEYLTLCCLPSAQRSVRLAADGLRKARPLAGRRRHLTRGRGRGRAANVDAGVCELMQVGGRLEVRAEVGLGGLSADDVQAQLSHGLAGSLGDASQPHTATGTDGAPRVGSTWWFTGTVPCRSSGRPGFAMRVLPRHGDPGLVTWG